MESEHIEISVIIPCYNCEKWIVKCLTALADQTYKNFEVICVNDCSSDKTATVISQLMEKLPLKITLITNEQNLGPAKSRNRAIKIAEGSWLAFCDSDDWYDPDFLELMLSRAKATGAEISMCEYRKVYDSNKASTDVTYLDDIKDDFDMESNIVHSKASLCLLLIKKELFANNEIPDLRNGEDIAFVPCIESRANNIALVKKPLYNYLMRSKSASNNIRSDKVYKSLEYAFSYIEMNFNREYKNALEFLGIRNVLYGVILNALKVNVSGREIKRIISDFEKKYPKWHKNIYLDTLPKSKKMFLKAIQFKLILICRIFAEIHKKISI